jgi:hypothetical protein
VPSGPTSTAETTIPPQVVDFSGITVNGFHLSRTGKQDDT